MFAIADVYAVVFFLIGLFISVPALLVVLNTLFPRSTGRAAQRLDQSLGRSFALGVPFALFTILLLIVVSNAGGPSQGLIFILLALMMTLGSIGGAGLARVLGKRMFPTGDNRTQTRSLVWGAVVFELACLVPIVGWFIFLPIAAVATWGAGGMALLSRSSRSRQDADSGNQAEALNIVVEQQS